MILADLEAIKRRCEAATPGPWAVPGANVFRVIAPDAPHDNPSHGLTPPYPWRIVAEAGAYDPEASDVEFIAHAREDVPALVEAVERLLSMLTDAQTEAEMQAARAGRLLVCAEWARLHIDIEWPDGPTGDTENWRRFVAVIDRDAGPLPELWAK